MKGHWSTIRKQRLPIVILKKANIPSSVAGLGNATKSQQLSNTTALVKLRVSHRTVLWTRWENMIWMTLGPVGTNRPWCPWSTPPVAFPLQLCSRPRTTLQSPWGLSPCPSNTTAEPVFSPVPVPISFCSCLESLGVSWPWLITYCWWTSLKAPWEWAVWVRAQPELGHPWFWLPGPGGATVPCLWQTDSVMGRGEHLIGSPCSQSIYHQFSAKMEDCIECRKKYDWWNKKHCIWRTSSQVLVTSLWRWQSPCRSWSGKSWEWTLSVPSGREEALVWSLVPRCRCSPAWGGHSVGKQCKWLEVEKVWSMTNDLKRWNFFHLRRLRVDMVKNTSNMTGYCKMVRNCVLHPWNKLWQERMKLDI